MPGFTSLPATGRIPPLLPPGVGGASAASPRKSDDRGVEELRPPNQGTQLQPHAASRATPSPAQARSRVHRSPLRLAAAAFILACVSCSAPRLLAHGSGHDAIVALTAELEKRPGDPALLLERGDRYRIHGELALARLDLAAAISNQPAFHPARLRLALVDRDEQRFDAALRHLDVVLAAESTNLLARSARAEVLIRAGRPADAVPDLDRVVAESRTPRPDLYLARARAQVAANTNGWRKAVAGLEEGLVRLGPLPSLDSLALELEEGGGDYDAGIRRIDRILAASSRKERWHLRRGDLLQLANRPSDASAEYRRALAALDALPERLRRTIASEELRREVEARLNGSPRP